MVERQNIQPETARTSIVRLWETCMGKSTFVKQTIGKTYLTYVFYPEKGHFFMQEFSERRHKVILFEEFIISRIFLSMH